MGIRNRTAPPALLGRSAVAALTAFLMLGVAGATAFGFAVADVDGRVVERTAGDPAAGFFPGFLLVGCAGN